MKFFGALLVSLLMVASALPASLGDVRGWALPGRGVSGACLQYAWGLNEVCTAQGIPSQIVIFTYQSGRLVRSHAFCAVQIGDQWWGLDNEFKRRKLNHPWAIRQFDNRARALYPFDQVTNFEKDRFESELEAWKKRSGGRVGKK